ncbi:hypothetical protein Tco_1042128 [Tanacetum coccineum]|uniref:Xylulose kinase-1 n=1 Tax=Tanacetum coccineum TaxID=301880 RepID=A0ABQ5GI52_9ASTR
MIAYLEKTEGNVEFHEVIDFLRRSYIYHALTVSPIVSTTFVEQFWTSAKSKTINNVRHITAKIAGKVVSISEASIRTDLIFDDADGIDSLPNQAIFNAIQRMGYEGDLSVLTFNKALFSPQWRFQIKQRNQRLSRKGSSRKQTKDALKEYAQSEGRNREMVDEDRRLLKFDLVLKMELGLTKKKLYRLEKIDPKDKGKKKIEEEDESESEDDDIPQAVRTLTAGSDELMA